MKQCRFTFTWAVVVILACLPPCTLSAFAQEKPVSQEELQEVRDALDTLNASVKQYRGIVDALRKIKVSGFLQPQFRYADVMDQPYSIGLYSGGAFPQYSKTQFQIRRGRLKVVYDNVVSQYVFQLEATEFGGNIPGGVQIKDAYLMFLDPWSRDFGMMAGIFYRPFGYEMSYSSGLRESPERARMYDILFPGARDLGAKVFYAPQTGPLTFLRVDLGIFNGSGPVAKEFDNFKDIMGRVAVQLPLKDSPVALDLGVSGYYGSERNNSSTLYEFGTTSAGVPGWKAVIDTLNFGKGVPREYFGGDFQFYYTMPVLGAMIFRAEFVTGQQPGTSSSSNSLAALASSALYKRKFFAFYLNYVQSLGPSDQFVAKYDVFDPNTKVTGDDFVSGSNLTQADIKVSTLGLGLIHHLDKNVKFLLYWEIIRNEEVNASSPSSVAIYRQDVRDNVLTFRIQYKF